MPHVNPEGGEREKRKKIALTIIHPPKPNTGCLLRKRTPREINRMTRWKQIFKFCMTAHALPKCHDFSHTPDNFFLIFFKYFERLIYPSNFIITKNTQFKIQNTLKEILIKFWILDYFSKFIVIKMSNLEKPLETNYLIFFFF